MFFVFAVKPGEEGVPPLSSNELADFENNPLLNQVDFIWSTQTVAAGDTAVLHCSFDAIFQQLRNGMVSASSCICLSCVENGFVSSAKQGRSVSLDAEAKTKAQILKSHLKFDFNSRSESQFHKREKLFLRDATPTTRSMKSQSFVIVLSFRGGTLMGSMVLVWGGTLLSLGGGGMSGGTLLLGVG